MEITTDKSLSIPGRQNRRFSTATLFGVLFFIALACVPWLASMLGEPFYVRLFMRMMIFSIMALGLNLILGYGGLVSFGHAMFVGIAAYVVGVLGYHEFQGEALDLWLFTTEGSMNALITWPIAILVTAMVSVAVGVVALRTTGLYFIMITLALAQMFYFLAVSLDDYGGQDGLQLLGSQTLGPLDLGKFSTLYYVVLASLAIVLVLVKTIVNSRFGLVLKASRQNDVRLAAVGIPVFWYRLIAFVISGALCALAGVLLISSQSFVSPADMAWLQSGELIIMVVLGGMGALFGPIFGAFFYLAAEYLLGDITEYWQMIFGPALIVIVLYARSGIAGIFTGKFLGKGGVNG